MILWTGLIRYEEIELARRCLCWISCKSKRETGVHLTGAKVLIILTHKLYSEILRVQTRHNKTKKQIFSFSILYNMKIHYLCSLRCTHQAVLVVTYVKVLSSMFQDELGRVRLVLTIIDIHLELISLGTRKSINTLIIRGRRGLHAKRN